MNRKILSILLSAVTISSTCVFAAPVSAATCTHKTTTNYTKVLQKAEYNKRNGIIEEGKKCTKCNKPISYTRYTIPSKFNVYAVDPATGKNIITKGICAQYKYTGKAITPKINVSHTKSVSENNIKYGKYNIKKCISSYKYTKTDTDPTKFTTPIDVSEYTTWLSLNPALYTGATNVKTTATFDIYSTAPKVKGVTKVTKPKNAIKATWEKQKGITGYVVEIDSVYHYVENKNATSATINVNKKKGHKYKVRIHSYYGNCRERIVGEASKAYYVTI